MSSKHTQKYEAWNWLLKLHASGFDRYYHNKLPTHLKNISCHRSATQVGYVVPTGNRDHGVKEYYIRQSILTLSTPAAYRGRGAV